MKCHLKPVLKDCFQWTGGPDQIEDPEWIVEAIEKGDVWIVEKNNQTMLAILTPEGQELAKPSDYIINSRMNGIYSISQAKFNELYDVTRQQSELINCVAIVREIISTTEKYSLTLYSKGFFIRGTDNTIDNFGLKENGYEFIFSGGVRGLTYFEIWIKYEN